MPELRLSGCRTRPLAGYLKGLGILRVLAHQHDASCRVRWSAGALELSSDLDEDALRSFWTERYAPTPVLSPWNAGSGFYPRANSTAVANLARIADSQDPRLERYRELVGLTRDLLSDEGIPGKPEGDQKERLVRAARRRWPDPALEWLDAAIVLSDDRLAFPPILGSGGNDGRFDFSSNYMRAVGELLLGGHSTAALLDGALFDSPTSLDRTTLAHFERDDSPVNSPLPATASLGNPWDLVLAIEGAVALSASAARRLGTNRRGQMVAPFTARPTAAGYGSAVSGESGRAELWLPLWSAWATYGEISALARESRAEVGSGTRRRMASTGLDFVRAAGELGVARGIDAFERYALLERAGQATLAVPVGRVRVSPRPAAGALRSIDPWLTRVLSFAGGDRCPQSIALAGRRLERTAFGFAATGSPADGCATLEAIGAIEQALARSAATATHAGLRPLFGADATTWIAAADDGSEEFAIASAIASLADHPKAMRSPALRDYLHGTVDGGRAFDESRRHAVLGGSAIGRLAAIHARRHLDALRSAREPDPARRAHPAYTFGSWCPLAVVHGFAAGALDDDRIMRLLLGMTLLERRENIPIPARASGPPRPQPALDVLLLAWSRSEVLSNGARGPRGDAQLGPRPGWAARLAAGRVEPVIRDALLRLQMAGLPPRARTSDLVDGAAPGTQLCAALLVPVAPHEIRALRRRVTAPAPDDANPQDTEEAA